MATPMFVPMFRTEECLTQIRECFEKNWTGLGFKTLEFEKAWCAYTEMPYAHFLNSNTAGMHLALHMFKTKDGWSDGDEVITPSLTFVAPNHAILYCNLKPVFADVDDFLCLDPEDIVRKLTPRTRAVMFVGIGGNTGQYQRIVELCRARGIRLIVDAAHLAGTRIGGKHVGWDADCCVFSFQALKNLPTADSGMVCFRDGDDDARARKLSWFGICKDPSPYKWEYDVEELGFNYHGNSIMAAIALVQLRYLDQDNAYRRQLASWYQDRLGKTDACRIVPVAPGCESSRHLFQILTNNRAELIAALHEQQIFPGVHYPDNTTYPMFAQTSDACPNAREASSQVLSLPMHLDLTFGDVEEIAAIVRTFAQ